MCRRVKMSMYFALHSYKSGVLLDIDYKRGESSGLIRNKE